MPRPVRCRRIEQMPAFRSFSPDDAPDADVIRLTLDEYETLRLMDAEGLNLFGKWQKKFSVYRSMIIFPFHSKASVRSGKMMNMTDIVLR